MKAILLKLTAIIIFFYLGASSLKAQLVITESNAAQALAQKLVGEGVTISNWSLKWGTSTTLPVSSTVRATGFFRNLGGTQIGLDSGIVLTNGKARSTFNSNNTFNVAGLNGNGTAAAGTILASTALGPVNTLSDVDLSSLVGRPTNDAVILEFDFVPLGDSIKFRYVFSSEEYPDYACSAPPNDFYDVFGFFISGPGITGKKNIALVPGTNTEVSIHTINGEPCSQYPQYYIDNEANRNFIHNGHTIILTAAEKVTPCAVYHLKLAIADVVDENWDSGVFLEAKSLTSNVIDMGNQTQTDQVGNNYLAEGCTPGSFEVRRPKKDPTPLIVNLSYGGAATNGVDVQTLPASVTIPANDSFVTVNVIPVIDAIDEGIEDIRVYAQAGCAMSVSDSVIIQIRDYDILPLTPDTAFACSTNSVQLTATTGYDSYQWNANPTLSSVSIRNPTANPVNNFTTYTCTATQGTCQAKDSVFLKLKKAILQSKTDIDCSAGTSGSITIAGNANWEPPLTYAINNNPYQSGNTFSGLPTGNYSVKIKDASGCIDSVQVELVQLAPDIAITTNITAATCSLTPDGQIMVTATGGNGNYTYSSNGTSYQSSNTLIVPEGVQTVYIKDGNGCMASFPGIVVPKINDLTVDAEPDFTICEGTSRTINATSNLATTVSWSPVTSLTNTNSFNPTTSTDRAVKYYVTANYGSCTKIDSVTVNVWPAPVAYAGENDTICYGITTHLLGSGGLDYHWTNDPSFISGIDISNPEVKPTITTTYYLNVTDANGCSSLQPDEVEVAVTPSVRIFAGNDTLVATFQPLQLNAIELNNSGVTEWEWSGAPFLDSPFVASPIALFTATLNYVPYEYIYTVKGKTPEGCEGDDEIKIKVYKGPDIYVPTAFTPNGDGKNDILYAFPVGLKQFKYFQLFNRWGKPVFFTKNPSMGWNGFIEGNKQQTGSFIWIAEGIDYTGKPIVRKGTVTLIR